MKISLEHYIATNNKPAADALLAKYGVAKATSWADLIRKVRYVLQKYKEDAARDLASIDTPYKRLIETYSITLPAVSQPTTNQELRSGACGCSSADGQSSCDGNCSCGGKCGNAAARIKNDRIQESRYAPADGAPAPAKKSDFEKYAPTVGSLAIGFMLAYVIFKK